MGSKAIDTRYYKANYRSSPEFGNNVLGQLYQADPVDVTGPPSGGRWLPCTIDAAAGTVFISNRVLRNRFSASRENLVMQCVKEWRRFDEEAGKEHRHPYRNYVGEYWDSIGEDYTGADRHVPWSAAFVSYCVLVSGGYPGFAFSAAHSVYVHKAINDRLHNRPAGFWGFRITEHKPQVGDIVCKRRTSANITYDTAANEDRYPSHCDIVVSVRADHVSTLGGNVRHTVKRSNYPIDSNGYLTGERGVYAVLRNNQ